MSKLSRVLTLTGLAILAATFVGGAEAFAAKHHMSVSNGGGSSGESRGGHQELLVDLSMHYVRDTKPDGGTDSAARFSIGGMFNEWVGLDLQGLYEVRSKSYLIGADFRFVPNEWFFLKGGFGAYSKKTTNELSLTPIAGAGIMARLTRDYYLVTETSYFTIEDRNNISFGVGLGITF